MRIIYERPPMYDEIAARFPIAGKPVFFSWGDVIYHPMGVTISPHLMLHEAMHGERQIKLGVERWWEAYISSDHFRLIEETLAHQVEYRSLLRAAYNRHGRRGALKQVAKRFASPMYGRMVSAAKAKKVLIEAAI